MTIKKRKTSKLIAGIAFLICFIPFHKNTLAQSFNYGIEVGVGAFNEKWTSDVFPLKGWGKEKEGLVINLFGELKHSSYFSTRLELGYMNKGYINDITWENPDGSIENAYNFRTDLKTFKIGVVERISFLASRYRPFVDIGANVQYVPDDIINNRAVSYMSLYGRTVVIPGYKGNAATLNGHIGIGIIYNEMVYFKIGYNQGLTKLLDAKKVEVIDRGIMGTLGININALY